MTFSQWKEIFDFAAHIVVVVGLPGALYQYLRKTRKEQQDREYGTYNALDEKYLEFVRLCFDHPQLDVFDIPDAKAASSSPIDQKQEIIAFTMLFSIFERAYLMYSDQSSLIKRRQWSGWLEYVSSYCTRENFRGAWRVSGNTFDTSFQTFVERLIQQAEPITSMGVMVRQIDPTNGTDVARTVELVTRSRSAGSKTTSNQLAYLLTSGADDLKLPTAAFLADSGNATIGAIIVTFIASEQLLLLSGVGIRAEGSAHLWHALLRALTSALNSGSLHAKTIAVEAAATEHLPASALPGMRGFRELDIRYHYPDRSQGRLWIWTTADAIQRAEVEAILSPI